MTAEEILAEFGEDNIEGLVNQIKDIDTNAYTQLQNAYGAAVLSDIEEKHVIKLASRGAPFSDEEMMFLMRMAGPDEKGHSYKDEDEWDDSVLNDYAEHLRNYLYTYKQEAKNIDPSIDPNEEHIGIMAQDLEQVNPACVRETPDGTKVVDTSRLALMNAGAIADLAREMKDIKELLSKLTGGNNG